MLGFDLIPQSAVETISWESDKMSQVQEILYFWFGKPEDPDYRNQILSQKSTPEEVKFLQKHSLFN